MLQAILAKIGAIVMAPLAVIGGVFAQTREISITPPPQVAMVYVGLASSSPTQISEGNFGGQAETASSTSSSTTVGALPNVVATLENKAAKIISNLLPVVKIPAKKKYITAATATSPLIALTSKTSAPPKNVTALWFLNQTTLALKQKIDGSYWAEFATDTGGSGILKWGLGQTSVGGGSLPQFNITYDCNPPPAIPDVSTGDVNPSFAVRISYACNITLAGGTTATKEFDFKTGGGRLLVALSSGGDTLLKDGRDTAGLTFTNQDTNPVAVTGLTFDISYTSLSTSSSPLVLRFADPVTDTSLFDYHLEDLPADPMKPHTWSQMGVPAQFSLAVPPSNSKGVFVEALGVQKSIFIDVNPEIKFVVRSVATDRTDIGKIVNSPTIDWTCIPNNQPYNPYSTSSQAMLGQACSQ